MKTITTNVFLYSELSDNAKRVVQENCRNLSPAKRYSDKVLVEMLNNDKDNHYTALGKYVFTECEPTGNKTTMKLYLVSQIENNSYDTYDSFVVVAASQEEARNTHPGDQLAWAPDERITKQAQVNASVLWCDTYSTWASSPDKVEVKYIGDATPDMKPGIICASFNAG